MSDKPRIAIALGDPAGIGAEITYGAVNSLRVKRVCSPVIFGDIRFKPVFKNSRVEFIETSNFGKIPIGKPSLKAGLVAVNALKAAVKFCLDGKALALVTAPVSKESFKYAAMKYPGHSEFLAALTGSKKIAMMMSCGKINSVMVTRHIPLAEVSKSLTTKDIVNTVKLCVKFLNKKGKVKVAVCALNPHASDNLILGGEEKNIIAPACKILKKSGIDVSGPLPADSAWLKTKNGLYDLICCMYHDQVMIPLKCIDASKIVNVTAGLPFVRTSPGHGTAFDIAGKNKADCAPMTEAVLYALKQTLSVVRF
ncbi:MAG: 4-hydroxythreonine-4-phosphate dehydrogenase PdxA [Endomicrobium sp.]|jgi:4-hydroxythreonine-4-phosphate dehydrogenase|nr:4-hydroxythreonine-4-phosphate dehydrogenase PdxA [Endomicrobium sp.]